MGTFFPRVTSSRGTLHSKVREGSNPGFSVSKGTILSEPKVRIGLMNFRDLHGSSLERGVFAYKTTQEVLLQENSWDSFPGILRSA